MAVASSRLFVPIALMCVIGVARAQQPSPAKPAPAKPTQTRPTPTKPGPARPAPETPRVAEPGREEASPPRRGPVEAGTIERGQRVFGSTCGFCHGADARGGAQGGSDLMQSAIVLEDEGGLQLGAFLKVGRPERNMPKFDLPPQQVSDIAAFLRSRVAGAISSRRATKNILVGDAKAGASYFDGPGGCTTCHSPTGDLKGIGAKYDPVMLQGRMIMPRGRGGYPGPAERDRDKPLRATVTAQAGEPVSGDVVYLSDFYVTLEDATGRRHTFARRGDVPKVEIVDPLHAHLALLRTVTDKEMHDLTAYLSTLK